MGGQDEMEVKEDGVSHSRNAADVGPFWRLANVTYTSGVYSTYAYWRLFTSSGAQVIQ